MNSNKSFPENWYKKEHLHDNVKASIIRLKSLEGKVQRLQEVLAGDVSRDFTDLEKRVALSQKSTEQRLTALEAKLDIILQHITGVNRDRQD